VEEVSRRDFKEGFQEEKRDLRGMWDSVSGEGKWGFQGGLRGWEEEL
jgi:hypothetical protein